MDLEELSAPELAELVQVAKDLIAHFPAGREDRLESLQNILLILEARLDDLQTDPPCGVTVECLEEMNVFASGTLELQAGSLSRALEGDFIGEEHFWCANGLYSHLRLMGDRFPRTNDAQNRWCIDAFLFRQTSLVPDGMRLVLDIKRYIPPISDSVDLSGYDNFLAVLASKDQVGALRSEPLLTSLPKGCHAFAISETKGPDPKLGNHIPQAISEMYTSAQRLQKTVIRGAVTNGLEWIFLLLKLNEDGNGAKYFQSQDILITNRDGGVCRGYVSVISAILAYWIRHSHEELGSDDYFTI